MAQIDSLQKGEGAVVCGGVSLLEFPIRTVVLVDAFWIVKGIENRRLVDIICKTDVLNEAL